MNPIPWSNVTFEKPLADEFILKYSDSKPSYLYASLLPINTSVTINDIETFYDYKYFRYTCRYTKTYGGIGRIGSGAATGGMSRFFTTFPPLRIIILVGMVGYFYVDIDSQGNAKLST